MKPRRLARDYKALETPPGTHTYGKNGTRNAQTNALQNERGFRISAAVLPYEYIGIIETDTNPVVFSTNGVYSAIGFYDEATDTYDPRIDDQYLPYKLGFRKDRWIKGEARRNFKNHIEVAWLDKYNPLRFADLDEPPTELSNYLLFPQNSAPDIDLDVINGGVLGMGSYFVAARYVNADGTETRYTTPSSPIFTVAPNFSALPGFSTGKSLKIVISNIDTRYTNIQVAVLRRVNGVTTAVELPIVPASGTVTIVYTGNEGEDITLEEVLIPAGFYENAGSITQLNDVLYLADMKESAFLNLQKYASLVKIRWQSQYRANIETDDDVRSGKIRTFKHGEVYAAFIVYHLRNGQVTDGFTVPGVIPTADSLTNDPAATAQGFTAKKFQTNTVGITELNKATQSGRPGIWMNVDEKYPNLNQFDSSDIGGTDLRNQPVRHHKMPTLNQTFNEFWSTTPGYGVTGLDALGLSADNIILPIELQDEIVGYEIFYARRDYSNATMISQGLTMYGARAGYSGKDIYFTGGNYNSRMLLSDGVDNIRDGRTLTIVKDIFKLHHADLIVNRPAIVPTFLASNYRLEAKVGLTAAVLNDEDELNFSVDYVTKGSVKTKTYEIRGIKDTGYLLNNSARGLIKNIKAEDGYAGTFNLTDGGFPIDVQRSVHGGRDTKGPVEITPYEQAHLVDLVVVKDNIYQSFNTQDLVRTGIRYSTDMTKPRPFAYNGDCFLVIHSYWSYGLSNSIDRFASNPGRVDGMVGRDEDTYTDEFFLGTSGYKVARRYVTESVMNLWQRYVDPTLPASKFWPASPLETMNGMDRNKDNNTIAISRDASAIGDVLNGIKTYDTNQVYIEQSPYKIIRSSKQAREGKRNSWKNFNALDYYETNKDMGPIMNLQGFNGNLIIHHRNALYVTQDKTTLQGDILSVTLGSGDIFRLQPQEGKPSKTGYAGTQHQLACMLTDFGYVFPDAETGNWFVFNEGGLQELNVDMYNFFKEYLNVPELNPFVGNGICVGYDGELKRILVTVKNLQLSDTTNYVPNYEETPEFFAQLVPGESIVFKDGRYQLFKGVNTSAYDCIVHPAPVIGDYIFNIQEDRPAGTLIGTLAALGDGAISYVIVSGNTDGAFGIDSATGKLVVLNQAALDVMLRTQFNMVVKVTDTHGGSDTGNVTVNLSAIVKAPVTADIEVEVPENQPNTTLLLTVPGTDPKGLALTWSIDSQTVPGALTINPANGQVLVASSAMFDFETNPIIEAVVRVSNGAAFALSAVRVILSDVQEPPTVANQTVTVEPDVTGVVLTWPVIVDQDDAQTVTTTIVSESEEEAFIVDLEARTVTRNPAFTLVEGAYTIVLRATDDGDEPLSADFTLTINVDAVEPPVPVTIDWNITQDSAPYVNGYWLWYKNGAPLPFVDGEAMMGVIGDTIKVQILHYHENFRWPDDASMTLTVENAAEAILYTYTGGNRDVSFVHEHEFVLEEEYYYIHALTQSSDATLAPLGFDVNNNTAFSGNTIKISAVDATTGLTMLRISEDNNLGAYNMKNDAGTQTVTIENTTGATIEVRLRTVTASSDETFNVVPGGIVPKVLAKAGFIIDLNPLP